MTYQKNYRHWLTSPTLTADERAYLQGLNDKQIEALFFAPLSFGTAGLRGVMDIGLHAMNVHIVRHATQALADLVLREKEESPVVVIGYDCRENSKEFAHAAASVLANNGIAVKLFSELCPTPQVSFAIRHYGAMAGINITASHNPREYNGYKVYWRDGAQLPTAHAAQMADVMAGLDVLENSARHVECQNADLLTILGQETDRLFLDCVLAQRKRATPPDKQLSLLYTPFHGAGYRLVPQVLREAGYTQVQLVPEQSIPDGTFPTVKSPNPENIEGFALAIEQAKVEGIDVIIGTDPDADRVGVIVREGEKYKALSGNQIGVMLADYLIKNTSKETEQMPCVITTIVSTRMIDVICKAHDVPLFRTFTGFKYIASVMEQHADTHSLLLGFEESFGYMTGDFCRDKDAVTASLLIVEMAHWYAAQDMTLADGLAALYAQYGNYREETVNLVMPGVDGLTKMRDLMHNLRRNPPQCIAAAAVKEKIDYNNGINGLPPSNVLQFELADGTTILVRPSGTEPKVKVYILSSHQEIETYVVWAKQLAG
ncbi:MAG: phospho-sugar mutase [Oscillospiraceae bacterium]|nr:phospho-sugar mutase [Oscillospiraceae bacterium]